MERGSRPGVHWAANGSGAGAQAKGVGARLPKAETAQGRGQSQGHRDWETVGPACLEGKAESQRVCEAATVEVSCGCVTDPKARATFLR